MRSVLAILRNALLVPLLGWTTLGMVVDVVSGPLTPEAALAVLCGCVLGQPATQSEDGARPVQGERSHRTISAAPCDSLPFAPPVAICNATWTTSMIAPHAVSLAASGLCGHAHVTAILTSPSFAPTPRVRRKHRLGSEQFSHQLCRLHC